MYRFEVCQKCKGSKKLKKQLEDQIERLGLKAKVQYRSCLDQCEKSPVLKFKDSESKKKSKKWKNLKEKKLLEKLESLALQN